MTTATITFYSQGTKASVYLPTGGQPTGECRENGAAGVIPTLGKALRGLRNRTDMGALGAAFVGVVWEERGAAAYLTNKPKQVDARFRYRVAYDAERNRVVVTCSERDSGAPLFVDWFSAE